MNYIVTEQMVQEKNNRKKKCLIQNHPANTWAITGFLVGKCLRAVPLSLLGRGHEIICWWLTAAGDPCGHCFLVLFSSRASACPPKTSLRSYHNRASFLHAKGPPVPHKKDLSDRFTLWPQGRAWHRGNEWQIFVDFKWKDSLIAMKLQNTGRALSESSPIGEGEDCSTYRVCTAVQPRRGYVEKASCPSAAPLLTWEKSCMWSQTPDHLFVFCSCSFAFDSGSCLSRSGRG